MSESAHSNVFIIRVVDAYKGGKDRTWFKGPYGWTRADQTANHLESVVTGSGEIVARECHVEPLWSDDECLRVDDYNRTTLGSLR